MILTANSDGTTEYIRMKSSTTHAPAIPTYDRDGAEEGDRDG
jgi:hypothetical protein